ncbi:MAG: DUF7662 domain-containing protein [Rhizomicrobium sp.]
MSKYGALGNYLRKRNSDEIPMTFAEIEKVTGVKLPPSAYAHRPWWSNNGTNSVLTKVWLEAGFRSAHVDMAGRRLVFQRIRRKSGFAEESEPFQPAASPKPPQGRHPMIGALKGTFTIEPGYDLTQPAMPEWADLIDEKYGPEKRK